MRRSELLIAFVISFLAILATPREATGQGATIRGRVADSTGLPITGAIIVLSPGGRRATSRDNGEYAISRVPAGTYTASLRRLGYVTPSVTVVVADDQAVQQDFVVRHTAVSLAEVVIGSRARHTAAEELAVPVDVFTSEQIQSQGTTETSQILSQLAPSVNFPRQSVSDASEIVRPFTMRGLSADHTLVLLNGKRRHHTALIHYYGAGQGAGSSGVDMNAIPAGAIGRLEILRDGAAAQYGSDAIAGVVNVVLKEGAFAPFLTADLGQYMTSEENPAALASGGSRPSYPRDGRTIDVNAGWGIPLGRGSLGLFAEYRDRQPTNRAGPDPVDMFVAGDADVVVDGNLVTKNNSIAMPNHHWGDGSSKDFMTFASANIPFNASNPSAGVYANGGYSPGRSGSLRVRELASTRARASDSSGPHPTSRTGRRFIRTDFFRNFRQTCWISPVLAVFAGCCQDGRTISGGRSDTMRSSTISRTLSTLRSGRASSPRVRPAPTESSATRTIRASPTRRTSLRES